MKELDFDFDEELERDIDDDDPNLVHFACACFEAGHDIPLDMETELLAMGIDVQELRNIFFD